MIDFHRFKNKTLHNKMDDIHQQAEFVIFFNEIGRGRYFVCFKGQVSGVTHQDNPEYVTVVVSVLPI